MSEKNRPLFLQTDGYRLRRLTDALRFLPFVGVFFVVVPGIMLSGNMPKSLSGVVLYFFGVWMALILITALLTRLLTRRSEKSDS